MDRSGWRAAVLGPLGWPGAWKVAGVLLVVASTVFTQVGVVLWVPLGLGARARRPVLATFLAGLFTYAVACAIVPFLAARSGRVPLPCLPGGPLAPRSVLFCAANRHYVVPELRTALDDVAAAVERDHPGTVVLYLDAGFPFGGMPLLPHLSHGDGRKVDLALLYADASGSPLGSGGSPIGYWGYVAPPPGTPVACPAGVWDLRWDLDVVQPVLSRAALDDGRTRALVRAAVGHPSVGKVLLEPHLQARLGVSSTRLRFQGCGAARHDDHVHVQLR